MSRASVLIGLAVLLVMVLAAVTEWATRVRTRLASLRRSSTLRTLDADEHCALAALRALTGCVYDDQVKRLRGVFTGGGVLEQLPGRRRPAGWSSRPGPKAGVALPLGRQ